MTLRLLQQRLEMERRSNQYICNLIAHLPISFKLLFKFSKQARSVVALNVHESYSTF